MLGDEVEEKPQGVGRSFGRLKGDAVEQPVGEIGAGVGVDGGQARVDDGRA